MILTSNESTFARLVERLAISAPPKGLNFTTQVRNLMQTVEKPDRIKHGEFVRRFEARYPQVFLGIDDIERGLLHCEMAVLARATSKAIESGDSAAATDYFAFMDEILANSDPAVENAVYVSYLENVFLGEDRGEFLHARRKLPVGLANALDQLETHLDALANAASAN